MMKESREREMKEKQSKKKKKRRGDRENEGRKTNRGQTAGTKTITVSHVLLLLRHLASFSYKTSVQLSFNNIEVSKAATYN